MLKGKSLLDYSNFFPPNEHEINKRILEYFQSLEINSFLNRL